MKHKTVNLQTGEETIIPFTAEEIAEREAYERDVLPGILLDSLRADRNQLLAETDYLALSDSTLTDEMRTYRQALRDLPANTTDPSNPVWPIKPTA
ncbi:MAG: phage tail assembly chaperone [Opitutae bacterium]